MSNPLLTAIHAEAAKSRETFATFTAQRRALLMLYGALTELLQAQIADLDVRIAAAQANDRADRDAARSARAA